MLSLSSSDRVLTRTRQTLPPRYDRGLFRLSMRQLIKAVDRFDDDRKTPPRRAHTQPSSHALYVFWPATTDVLFRWCFSKHTHTHTHTHRKRENGPSCARSMRERTSCSGALLNPKPHVGADVEERAEKHRRHRPQALASALSPRAALPPEHGAHAFQNLRAAERERGKGAADRTVRGSDAVDVRVSLSLLALGKVPA